MCGVFWCMCQNTLNDRRPGVVVRDRHHPAPIAGDAVELLDDRGRGGLGQLVEDEGDGREVVRVARQTSGLRYRGTGTGTGTEG